MNYTIDVWDILMSQKNQASRSSFLIVKKLFPSAILITSYDFIYNYYLQGK